MSSWDRVKILDNIHQPRLITKFFMYRLTWDRSFKGTNHHANVRTPSIFTSKATCKCHFNTLYVSVARIKLYQL